MSGAQLLPPKMAAQFAEKAKQGLADRNLGRGLYEFYQGNNVITLVSVDPPIGNIRKVSIVAMKEMRERAAKEREEAVKVAMLAASLIEGKS